MVRKLLFGVILLFLSTSTVTAQAPGQVFVLVHGAFQDSSSWANVAPLLEAAGHTVISVDLPGHGADETPLNEITLASYRDAIIAAIETQDQPVVLVGHSFGGFTISNVAEAIPERVAKLVYVAAYLPRSGDSLVTLSGLDHNNGFTQKTSCSRTTSAMRMCWKAISSRSSVGTAPRRKRSRSWRAVRMSRWPRSMNRSPSPQTTSGVFRKPTS